SDSRGLIPIANAAIQGAKLVVRAARFEPTMVDARSLLEPTAQRIDLAMRPATLIRGHLTESSGTPLRSKGLVAIWRADRDQIIGIRGVAGHVAEGGMLAH